MSARENWSVYEQSWQRARYRDDIDTRDYAALPPADRARIDVLPAESEESET